MKLFILIAALSASHCLMAGEPGFAITKDRSKSIYNIIYEGSQISTIRLTIFDGRGNMVVKKIFRSMKGFKLPVNFNEMPGGQYLVKVVSGENVYSEKINHTRGDSLPIFHVTKLNDRTLRFLVSIVTPEPKLLTLTVRDQRGNVIHQTNHRISRQYAMVVNIQKLTGPFIFSISDGNGAVEKIVK